MNIYLQITRQGDLCPVRPADGNRRLGVWKDTSFDLGKYRITFNRQVLASGSKSVNGWSEWSRGHFMWTGTVRNQKLLAGKLGCAHNCGLAKLLAAGLERWSWRVVEHIEGPLCLVTVDELSREVRWIRDAFGGVPTMYSTSMEIQGRRWMGTCLCSFEDEPISPRRARDERRLASYLLPYQDASERDFFRDVNRLKPAGILIAHLQDEIRLSRQEYWQPAVVPAIEERFYFRRLRRKLASLVEQSVNASKHPCISLSAGLDSTLLAAAWVDSWRQQRVSHRPTAATMSFPNHPATDESQGVRAFADELKIELSVHNLEHASALARSECFRDFWGYGPGAHPGESYETEFLTHLGRASGVTNLMLGVGGEHLFPFTTAKSIRFAHKRCLQYRDSSACRLLPHLLRIRHHERSLYRAAVVGSIERLAPGSMAQIRWARSKLHSKDNASHPSQLWSHRAYHLATENKEAPRHYFDSWDWELGRRVIWREQLRSGMLLDEPYQSTSLLKLAAGLPTQALETVATGRRRALMRRLVAGGVPEHIRHATKHGTFTQYTWRTMCEQRQAVEELLNAKSLDDLGLVNVPASQRALRYCCADVYSQDESTFSRPIGSVTFWRPLSIALWLQS